MRSIFALPKAEFVFGKLVDCARWADAEVDRTQMTSSSPCPESNPPTWKMYPPGNPFRASNQGEAYRNAFGVAPVPVTPKKVFK